MAEKISDANKISIDVIDYGLNKRLENSLEITVFRIIQELTTNIIKHSKATNAQLNIIIKQKKLFIEIVDDGVGIEQGIINNTKAGGIGLRNMKSRIEYLGGVFEIGKKLKKGTKININISL